ncbi:MAG: Ig-like domain-containing protein, partial [Candidatus Methylumidiphilus sp.]
NICHNANNRSIKITPEWDWYNSGPGFAERANFCVVQGIIETPATSMTLSRGATVNLKARGFSPKGKTSQLTYTWSFSDGRPPIVLNPVNQVASVDNVPLPISGNTLTITLNTTGALDSTNDSETRVITISDDPITVDNDTYSVQSGNTLSVTSSTGVLQGDSGVGTLTATRVTNVTHGTLVLNPNGAFSYTPNASFVGADSFTYTASNGVITSTQATVTLNVTAAPPVANADSYSALPGVALTVASPGVLANDAGSGTLTAILGTNVTKGSLALSGNGSFSYTSNAGFTGTDSFTYKVNNGGIDSTPGTVTLAVGACTDKDKDGYSPEGGSCGPVDCNDKQMTMNPGLKEICTNKIDDDCNGKVDQADPACSGADCIGAKLGNLVKIDSANWSSDKLAVTGSKAAVGATVTVSKLDPVTLAATTLGTTTVIYNGTWKLEQAIVGSANAPCRIKVVINAATGIRAVTGSTANCSSQNGAPASCGP